MSFTVASNAWAEIVHHPSDGMLEERWLPEQMTDGAFMASLALLALEAERLRPSAILIDATQFPPGGPCQILYVPQLVLPLRRPHNESEFARSSRARRLGWTDASEK